MDSNWNTWGTGKTSFSREMGGGGGECNIPPSKMSAHACSQGWHLENEHMRSFSREVEGGGGGSNMPPSKTSAHAHSHWQG